MKQRDAYLKGPMRRESDDRLSVGLTFATGAKLAVVSMTTTILIIIVVVRAAGVNPAQMTWLVFASVLITGATSMLQSIRFGRIGIGCILVVSSTGVFIAVAVQALKVGGPSTLAVMVVVSALFQLILSSRLSLLRQIMTAKIAGTLIMLVGVSVVPAIFELINYLPQGEPTLGARLSAFVTIAVIVVLMMKVKGTLRQWIPVIGIGAGAFVGAFFGLYDTATVAAASWVGLPQLNWPGFDLSFGRVFWSLLPGFLLATIIISLRTISSAVSVLRFSNRTPMAIDYRLVQNAITTEGVGNMVAGLAGAFPSMAMLSNVSFVKTSKITSRHIGVAAGVLLIVLAFVPKILVLVTAIPGPVFGAYILLAMGLLFLIGLKMVLKGGVDRQSGLIVSLSLLFGIGIQANLIAPGFFTSFMGGALDNAMTTGGICVILLTWGVNLTYSRAQRLEMTLELAGLPALQEFLRDFSSRYKWNEATTTRFEAVGEEVLLTLLDSRDATPDAGARRMRLFARRVPGGATLEFISVMDTDENLENQVALLSSQIDADLFEKEVSLRILRHLAASVRHQQFYGADIITVRVDASKRPEKRESKDVWGL